MIARLLILLALVAGLALPGSADAKRRIVPYADSSDYPEAVRLAVRSWNTAQTAIKLVPTNDPATVVVPIDSQATLGGGHAALGGLLGVQVSREEFDTFTLPQQATVLAHVIGHALRLPDITNNGCSVMYPAIHRGVLATDCRPGALPAGRFRCGAATVDGRLLAAAYGGRARKTRGYCRPRPGQVGANPAGLTATFSGGHVQAVVAMTNTGSLPADLGLLIGSTFIPLPSLIEPGATQTVSYAMCPFITTGRLYSPTFDALLGPPMAVPLPGC